MWQRAGQRPAPRPWYCWVRYRCPPFHRPPLIPIIYLALVTPHNSRNWDTSLNMLYIMKLSDISRGVILSGLLYLQFLIIFSLGKFIASSSLLPLSYMSSIHWSVSHLSWWVYFLVALLLYHSVWTFHKAPCYKGYNFVPKKIVRHIFYDEENQAWQKLRSLRGAMTLKYERQMLLMNDGTTNLIMSSYNG